MCCICAAVTCSELFRVVPNCSSGHITCCLLSILRCAGFAGSILYSRSGRLALYHKGYGIRIQDAPRVVLVARQEDGLDAGASKEVGELLHQRGAHQRVCVRAREDSGDLFTGHDSLCVLQTFLQAGTPCTFTCPHLCLGCFTDLEHKFGDTINSGPGDRGLEDLRTTQAHRHDRLLSRTPMKALPSVANTKHNNLA